MGTWIGGQKIRLTKDTHDTLPDDLISQHTSLNTRRGPGHRDAQAEPAIHHLSHGKRAPLPPGQAGIARRPRQGLERGGRRPRGSVSQSSAQSSNHPQERLLTGPPRTVTAGPRGLRGPVLVLDHHALLSARLPPTPAAASGSLRGSQSGLAPPDQPSLAPPPQTNSRRPSAHARGPRPLPSRASDARVRDDRRAPGGPVRGAKAAANRAALRAARTE